MKQLCLELQEKLLIVEGFNLEELNDKLKIYKGNEIKFLCKGDELTEEVAFQLVKENSRHGTNTSFVNYKGSKSFFFAKESFISAIESKGYFWNKNELTDSITAPDIQEWNELQAVTFNPSRTLIFKIS